MISLVWCLTGVVVICNIVTGQPPPELPGGGESQGTCLDIAFMIDVSCSVDNVDMIRGIDFAKSVLMNLDSKMTPNRDTTVRVAMGIFIDLVHKIFYLDKTTENKAAIIDELEESKQYLKPNNSKCKTNTHYAIDALNSEYFQNENGNRDDSKYPNVAVIITDARTMPRKPVNNNWLGRYLDESKNQGITIYTVLVENNRNRPPLDDGLLTGGDNSKLFDIKTGNDEEEAARLANVLKQNLCEGGTEVQPDECADIIFGLDVSCSITEVDKELSKYVASKVFTNVFDATGIYGLGVSLIVFDNTARVSFIKSDVNPFIDDVATKIRDSNVTNAACRTRPEKLFDKVKDLQLDSRLASDLRPIYMVLFSDGMTSPINERGRTIAAATGFKSKDVTELLTVKLKNDRGKDGNSEFSRIPSSSNYLFPLDGGFLNENYKDGVAQEVADVIIAGLLCPSE